MQKKHWTAFLIIILFLLSLSCASLADYLSDDFCNKYRMKYSYDYKNSTPYEPTCLSYVSFTRHVIIDSGVGNGMQYALYGGVSEECLQDYISYISRFGYSVAFDTVQNKIRTIEMRDNNAPSYMPVNFRVYFDSMDQSIVIVEPICCEEAYDQIAQSRFETFQIEMKTKKRLTSNIAIILSSLIITDSYQTYADQEPFSENIFMSKVKELAEFPIITQKLEDGTNVSMVQMKELNYSDSNTLWLMKLTIENSEPTLKLSDLEFCIGDDDVIVAYPFQIADELQYRYSKPLLRIAEDNIIGDKRTIWMVFPSLSNNVESKLRLYVSFAQDHTPLLERLSFGFALN